MAQELEMCEVVVTSDQMEAYLTLKQGGGTPDRQTLLLALQRSGVVFGVDESRLAALAANPVYGAAQLVAKGQPPVDGAHEKIAYHFDANLTSKVEEDETGAIDWRSIKNFLNFQAGQVLAEKTAVIPGKEGRNVLGQVIPAREGKPLTWKFGKGVEITNDGLKAIAQVDGHPAIIADRLTVSNTVEVPAHVDYSIGNIDFIGNVKVRGDVMPGFAVKTKGNLEIAGNVEQADLEVGGNLDLRGIVFGQGNSRITVLGDAKIGAIDQAEVKVSGNLKVNSYIRHSTVLVGAALEVIGPKGNIIGGEISAFQGINCPFVGNAMATLTKLTVGNNPFIAGEFDQLQAEFNELDMKLRQAGTAITSAIQRGNHQLVDKLKQIIAQLEPQHSALQEQLTQIKLRVAETKEARIRVKEKVFPGVIVNFRDRLQYKTMDEAQRLSFYEEGAEIRTGPY
jgi:uncharacterized protein